MIRDELLGISTIIKAKPLENSEGTLFDAQVFIECWPSLSQGD
jgi:hypothetical protein